MSGTMIKCTKCRKQYDPQSEICPHCGTPNKLKLNPVDTPLSDDFEPIDDMEETASEGYSDEYTDEYSDEDYGEGAGEETTPEPSEDGGYEEAADSEGDYVENDADTEEGDGEEYYEDGDMMDDRRSKIDWPDEEAPKQVDYSQAYDENGVYNPNFDQYYEDTKALIDNEVDSLLAGLDKLPLKIAGGVAAVIALIVYLVFTLR